MSLEEIRGAASIDRVFFGATLFPQDIYREPADGHYRLNDLLNQNHHKNAVEAHREWAKSTWLSTIDPLHQIAYCPPGDFTYLVICSEARDQSINFLARIQEHLRFNENYRRLYGDKYKNNRRWGTADIILNDLTRVQAIGTRQRVRGLIHHRTRPKRAYFDDIESELNAETLNLRSKNRAWFFGAAVPFLSEEGQIFLLQTPIAADCIIHRVMHDEEWNVLREPVCTYGPDGEMIPNWAAAWPVERILRTQKMYENQGLSWIFDREYMLIPTTGQMEGIGREDFRYYRGDFCVDDFGITYIKDFLETDRNGKPILEGTEPRNIVVNTATSVDPAIGENKRNCRTAITGFGMCFDGNYYCLMTDAFWEKSTKKIGYRFAQISHELRVERCGVEVVSFQEAIREHVEDWEEAHGVSFSKQGFKPRSSKDLRAEWVTAKFKAAKVFVRVGSMEDYIQEMIEGTSGGGRRDYPDSTFMTFKCLYKPEMREPVELKEKATINANLIPPSWRSA